MVPYNFAIFVTLADNGSAYLTSMFIHQFKDKFFAIIFPFTADKNFNFESAIIFSL